jgi:hypothetical protein
MDDHFENGPENSAGAFGLDRRVLFLIGVEAYSNSEKAEYDLKVSW